MFQKTKNVEKTKSRYGPTTRSRSNAAPMKDVVIEKEVIEKEANNATHEAPTDIELPEPEVGQGTMAAFLAMRKRQRENVEKAGTSKNAPVTAEAALSDYEDEEDQEAQGIFLPFFFFFMSFFLRCLVILDICYKMPSCYWFGNFCIIFSN